MSNPTDTYIKDRITEIAKEAVNYTPSPLRMPLDTYIEDSVKSLLNSLIGIDDPLIGILSPEKSNDTIESINRDAYIKNTFRRELRERAGL